MSNEPEPIKTSDTPFAAFLFYHRHVFVGMKPEEDDARRLEFVFIQKEDTDELKDLFYFGKPSVNPKWYYNAVDSCFRELKKYMRENGR